MATAVATQTETQQPEAQKVQLADSTKIEQKSKASFNGLSEELKGEIVERVSSSTAYRAGRLPLEILIMATR